MSTRFGTAYHAMLYAAVNFGTAFDRDAPRIFRDAYGRYYRDNVDGMWLVHGPRPVPHRYRTALGSGIVCAR